MVSLILPSLVLVSWELLVHLFQDVEYLRTKGWYRRPVIWAYFFQRYGAFVVAVSQAVLRLGKPSSCYAAGIVALTIGGVVVLPSISLIYLYRMLAIWNKKREVKYTLIFLWVVLFGASMTAPFAQSAANLPNGECAVVRNEAYTPASFIANAIYDAVVFILTAVKLGANRRQYKNFRSPVQTVLLRDGILYFGVSVIISMTDIIFLLAIKSPELATTIIPLHVALASIMTTRLVNNVFQVVTGGTGITVDFFSASAGSNGGNHGSGMIPMGGAGTLQALQRQQAAKNATLPPTFIIGSGVGTEEFGEKAGVNLRSEGPSTLVGPGKEMV